MINKVILVGNVGNDPKILTFEDGGRIATFSIATTERAFKTRDGKEVPERTEWHNIVVQRALVTIVEAYVKKGQQLYVEGKIKTRSYEQEGVKKYVTEIVCETLKLLGHNETVTQSVSSPNTTPAAVEE